MSTHNIASRGPIVERISDTTDRHAVRVVAARQERLRVNTSRRRRNAGVVTALRSPTCALSGGPADRAHSGTGTTAEVGAVLDLGRGPCGVSDQCDASTEGDPNAEERNGYQEREQAGAGAGPRS